jgi:prevent-host-death family protein
MHKIVSATHARIHFGEIMRQARQGPVIVERDGKPEVVVVSKQAFDELLAGAQPAGWRELLNDAHRRVREEAVYKTMPAPEDMLDQIRANRDADHDHLR